jgi:hypothetical protein
LLGQSHFHFVKGNPILLEDVVDGASSSLFEISTFLFDFLLRVVLDQLVEIHSRLIGFPGVRRSFPDLFNTVSRLFRSDRKITSLLMTATNPHNFAGGWSQVNRVPQKEE